ncbi:hypothetical protein JCM18905_1772 [Vibrio sp. JCM 18905]|nr:hypothetical protein JCM18905_1772 [Vibrio sp. JCM 18905]
MISKAHCDIPIILIKRQKEKIFSKMWALNKSNVASYQNYFNSPEKKQTFAYFL